MLKIRLFCANGMSTSLLVKKMEEAAKKVSGVKDAGVAFMTQKMSMEFEDGANVNAVMEEVRKQCKKVESDCEIFL